MKAITPADFTATFPRRNFLAYQTVTDILGAVSTRAAEAGVHIDTPLGRLLFAPEAGLEERLEKMGPRFAAITVSDPKTFPLMVSVLQDMRFLIYDGIIACLTPEDGDLESMPDDVGQILEAMQGNRARLKPMTNFPWPEEKGYPEEFQVIFDIFIWDPKFVWNFSDAEPEINGLIESLEIALGELEFPRNNLPFVETAVALLRILRELIRPTKAEAPDVDFEAVIRSANSAAVHNPVETEAIGNPS